MRRCSVPDDSTPVLEDYSQEIRSNEQKGNIFDRQVMLKEECQVSDAVQNKMYNINNKYVKKMFPKKKRGARREPQLNEQTSSNDSK